MMDLILLDDEEIICIIAIIFFTFVGSFSKDYLNLFHNHEKMEMNRIIVSTVTAFIVVYACSEFIINLVGFKGLIGVAYVVGLSGFDLLNRMNSIEKLFHLVRFIVYSVKNYDNIDDIEDTINAGKSRSDSMMRTNNNINITIRDDKKRKR